MQKQVLNYRIFITPEKTDRGIFYNAHCPTLNIRDRGNSIQKALKAVNNSIKRVVEDLVREKQEIIGDNILNQLLTTVQVKVPVGIKTTSTC